MTNSRVYLQNLIMTIIGISIYLIQFFGLYEFPIVSLVFVVFIISLTLFFIFLAKNEVKSSFGKIVIKTIIIVNVLLLSGSLLTIGFRKFYRRISPFGDIVKVLRGEILTKVNQEDYEIYRIKTKINVRSDKVKIGFEVEKGMYIKAIPQFTSPDLDTINTVDERTVVGVESQDYLRSFLYDDLNDAHQSIVRIGVFSNDTGIQNTTVKIRFEYFYQPKWKEVIRCYLERFY